MKKAHCHTLYWWSAKRDTTIFLWKLQEKRYLWYRFTPSKTDTLFKLLL